jgi:ssDNA-binding Zn-finger/Zn-ribbon topoisomerase 1
MVKSPTCPLCKSTLVVRTNRNTQEEFYGCSSFPKCRYTKPIYDDPRDYYEDDFDEWHPGNPDNYGHN